MNLTKDKTKLLERRQQNSQQMKKKKKKTENDMKYDKPVQESATVRYDTSIY